MTYLFVETPSTPMRRYVTELAVRACAGAMYGDKVNFVVRSRHAYVIKPTDKPVAQDEVMKFGTADIQRTALPIQDKDDGGAVRVRRIEYDGDVFYADTARVKFYERVEHRDS